MGRKLNAKIYISMNVKNREFIEVKPLKCVGSIIMGKNETEEEILSRNKYFYEFLKLQSGR